MKELDEVFSGIGEVKDFEFKQIEKSDKAFVYEVCCPDINERHYEVFKRKESKDSHSLMGGVDIFFPARVKYPTPLAFGDWAWCFKSHSKAISQFSFLNKTK